MTSQGCQEYVIQFKLKRKNKNDLFSAKNIKAL